jgi:hypothetical protein
LIFQGNKELKVACAKHDAEMIKKNEEIRQLKQQVKELKDYFLTM